MTEYADGRLTRRTFLGSLAALALAPPGPARSGSAPAVPVRGLSHVALAVSDPERSLDFYQGLFGMPVQARRGLNPCLRVGAGPHFLELAGTEAGAAPEIARLGLAVEGFDAARTLNALERHGVAAEDPAEAGGGLAAGLLRARSWVRGGSLGGAIEGTQELFLGDPDGIVVQLQDGAYCGGAGVLGDICPEPEPASADGLFRLWGINHCTVFVADAERSLDFYQRVFGLPVTKTQGSMPLLDVGTDGQILGFVSVPGSAAPARIHHVCLTIDGFQHERVLEVLDGYGVTPREDPGGGLIEPLSAYVTLRMPDRGGAPEGTPELYFTDPDGLLIQLQDPRYCGGAGYLGEVCAFL